MKKPGGASGSRQSVVASERVSAPPLIVIGLVTHVVVTFDGVMMKSTLVVGAANGSDGGEATNPGALGVARYVVPNANLERDQKPLPSLVTAAGSAPFPLMRENVTVTPERPKPFSSLTDPFTSKPAGAPTRLTVYGPAKPAANGLASMMYWPVSGSVKNPPSSGMREFVPAKSSLNASSVPSGPYRARNVSNAVDDMVTAMSVPA